MANNKPIGVAYEDQAIVNGTVDNTVIGGTTAAAGTFTNLSAGNLTATSTVLGANANFTGNLTIGSTTLNSSEVAVIDGVVAGTAAANKAVVVDANKDVSSLGNLTLLSCNFAVGGFINSDSGTATASAGAATVNKMAGVVTSESLTTAGLAAYTLTLTNSVIAAADMVFVSVADGSNTQGTVVVGRVTPGSGSCTILIQNVHASQALNGTVVISFLVVKA